MMVTARGLEFAVRAGGPPAGPAVLLLHGFPQHAGMWDAVVPALHEAGLRTFAPDQRGYSPGARPAAVDAYRMVEVVADAVALLDALDIERAHVVGHDWGAVAGWHLACDHAHRLHTLTALSVPHPGAIGRARHIDPDQVQRMEYMRLFATEGTAERVLLEDGARRLRRLFSPLPAERVEQYVRPLLEPGALTAALNWYRRLERANLGPAKVAATLIWGSQDPAVGPTAARGCEQFIAPGLDFRFVGLDGVSHWIADEVPDLVAAHILARAGA